MSFSLVYLLVLFSLNFSSEFYAFIIIIFCQWIYLVLATVFGLFSMLDTVFTPGRVRVFLISPEWPPRGVEMHIVYYCVLLCIWSALLCTAMHCYSIFNIVISGVKSIFWNFYFQSARITFTSAALLQVCHDVTEDVERDVCMLMTRDDCRQVGFLK